MAMLLEGCRQIVATLLSVVADFGDSATIGTGSK